MPSCTSFEQPVEALEKSGLTQDLLCDKLVCFDQVGEELVDKATSLDILAAIVDDRVKQIIDGAKNRTLVKLQILLQSVYIGVTYVCRLH